MKDAIKSMTDEELDAAIAAENPQNMSDDELDTAIEKSRSGFVDVLDTVTKPIQKVSNLVDYFTLAPLRAAAIQGKKEYDDPESTPGSIIAAASRGSVDSAIRNPLEYDPTTNFAELGKAYGVTDKPINEFVPGMPDAIGEVPVNQAAGLAAEVVLDPFTVAGRSFKPLGTMLKEKSIANSETALARMSDAGLRKTSDWVEKAKLQSVAETMQENNLIKHVTDPKKLREAVVGKYMNKPNPKYPGKNMSVKIKEGLKDVVGKKLDDSISRMDDFLKNNKQMTASKKDLAQEVLNEVNNSNEALSSGTTYSKSDRAKALKAVDGIFKMNLGGDNLSIRDVVNLKRAAQEYVYDLKKSETFGVQGTKNLKNIYEAVDRKTSDYLNNFAISQYTDKKAGLDFLKSNQQYSDLTVLDKMTENAKYNSMMETSLGGTLASMGVGGAIGAGTGLNPAITAGMFGVAKGVGASVSGKAPAATARMQDLMNIPGLPIEQYLNYGQRPAAFARGVMGNPDRSPQSLPLQLVEFQIPRNSNDILANKDVVLAKIAQMSNDPAMTEMFADALNKHPEKLKKVLPALIMKFPDLFEDDDYNRVDGKVYDPRMKQKAINDIQNNKTMPLRERAFKIKRLQQEGLLD
jgi:hypothetical protein